jgi:hypothetical protein
VDLVGWIFFLRLLVVFCFGCELPLCLSILKKILTDVLLKVLQ